MLSCFLRRPARGLHAPLCSGSIPTGFALSAASSGCSKQRARSAFSRARAHILLLIGSLASIAATAYVSHPADPPGAVLTLAQAEHELLRRNPSIAEAQKLRQALTHQAIAMAQLPDPQLGLMAQNVPVGSLSFAQGPNAMLSVGVSQEFPPFGERAAKGQLGQSRTDAQYFGLLATRAQKLLALRQTWATAVYDRHAITVLRHQQRLAQASVDAAIARVRAGDGTEADALRARAAVLSLKNSLLQARSLKIQADAGIAELLARPDVSRIATQWPALPRPASLATLEARLPGHPLVREAESRVQKSQARVAIARSAYYPDVTVSGSYGQSYYPGMPNTMTVGISVSLPLFVGQRQDQQLAAAKDRVAATQDALERRELQFHRRLQVAFAQYLQAQSEEQLTRTQLLPVARAAFSVSLADYRSGRITLDELLKAQGRLLTYALEDQQLRRAVVQAEAALDYFAARGENHHESYR
ncbi:MAG: TolC family protein [Acidiferrobacteraceae bacterium]